MLNMVYFYFLCSFTLSGAQLIFYLWSFFSCCDHRHASSFILSTSAFFAWLPGVGLGNYLEGGKERADSSLAGDEAWDAVECTFDGGLREDVG